MECLFGDIHRRPYLEDLLDAKLREIITSSVGRNGIVMLITSDLEVTRVLTKWDNGVVHILVSSSILEPNVLREAMGGQFQVE